MYRRSFLALASAATLSACVPGPRSNPLSRAEARNLRFNDITVNTGGTAYLTNAAGEYRNQLAPTLEAELRQEFSDRIGADGTAQIIVDISRLNLADSFRTATGGDQSRLTGSVRIVTGGATVASYPLDVTAGEAAETRTGVLIGAAINSRARFFRRLTNSFAAETYQLVTA
ncbi:hypothetical protein SAMN04488012_10839 [Palleronia salina]|uniref:LPS-assembly lipoprotein n=1 Tax=Palleronia salina TaxID=313368 RepID=A0A1M6IMN2_9RHOB|nr:hypothetical protein [Palleronia salina]SHJ35704.1 hypothetical protein SAMN04488012_10839 [Palleronia salina]